MSRAPRRPAPTERLLILLALLLAAAPVRAASRIDPRFQFRTLATEHFRVHFHQRAERTARRLASIAEETRPAIARRLGVEGPRLTHVILVDQSELANGWATPLPYNTILVTMSPPSGAEPLGAADDWLRLVFVHEFTHIVQLDRSEGWARLFRGVFGRTPIAFPNLFLPAWSVEGVAVWEESHAAGPGRLQAGDFRAIEQTAGRAGVFPPLDQANGGVTNWPGGNTPYVFGAGFHDYLAREFGEERFADLYTRSAAALPFFGHMAFRQVYDTPLGQLWDRYRRALTVAAPPAATTQATRLTHHGFTVLAPRFAVATCPGCAPDIVYTVRNPHALPQLRQIGADGEGDRLLTTRYLGSTSSSRGDVVLFDQQEVRRNTGLYSDLYLFDRARRTVRPLTREARLLDPDLGPDGTRIVSVHQEDGRRELVTATLTDGQLSSVATLAGGDDLQYETPRWSPDGETIVAARRRAGAASEIVLVDAATGRVRVLASSPQDRFVTPTWRPDGNAIVAAVSLNGDPFDIYELSLDGAALRRLTSTAGALWPDVSRDGAALVFAGYTADGFDVFTLPYPDTSALPYAEYQGTAAAPQVPPVAAGGPLAEGTTADYSPLATLRPTTWTPLLDSGQGTRLGFTVSGEDVLARHRYGASVSWLLQPPEGYRAPDRLAPDFLASYVYDRWRPLLFATLERSTRFASAQTEAGAPPLRLTGRELQLDAGVLLPVFHARSARRLLAAVSTATTDFDGPLDVSRRVSLKLGASTASALTFGYSISPERGIVAGARTEIARRAFGAADDGTIGAADVRVFAPGLARHHVVAMRLAAGGASGFSGRRNLPLGGTAASPDVLDFGDASLGLLRGFTSNAFFGTRLAVANVDYRWALARPQRGLGTWPLLLHTLHAAVFADAGDAWTPESAPPRIRTSIGGELSANVVLGYSLPLTVSVGGAWRRNPAEPHTGAAVYARVGRAF